MPKKETDHHNGHSNGRNGPNGPTTNGHTTSPPRNDDEHHASGPSTPTWNRRGSTARPNPPGLGITLLPSFFNV